MLRKLLLTLVGASLTIPASPSLAAQEIRFKPVTPWHVDWTKTSCTLIRGFGDKDDPQVLQFEQFSQGQAFQLLVTAKALRSTVQDDRPTLTYTNSDNSVQFGQKLPRALMGLNAKRVPTLFVPQSDLFGDAAGNARTVEAAITQIRVKAPGTGRTIIFETGPLDKPFDAMRACTDNLVKTWGLDPDKMRQLTREPVPLTRPATWLRSSDYPRRPLISGEQALVTFRLLVDGNGNPTDCLVQRSYSNDEAFDRLTCKKILERARFDPALDAEGKPTNAYYVDTVIWVIGA